jgi:hypothetical protein
VQPQLRIDLSTQNKQTAALEMENVDKTGPVDQDMRLANSHLMLALQFVKSVKGLQNAKAALAELESILSP